MKNQEISNRVLKGLLRQSLYYFPISAVTNYYKSNGLNNTSLLFYNSEIQHRSHWAKIKVSPGLHSFLEAPGKNPFPSIFHLLESAHIPWPTASSSAKPARAGQFSLTSQHSLLLPSLPHFFLWFSLLPLPLPFLMITFTLGDNPGKSPSLKVSWLATLIPLCCGR